jgi:hypothetical protein
VSEQANKSTEQGHEIGDQEIKSVKHGRSSKRRCDAFACAQAMAAITLPGASALLAQSTLSNDQLAG